MLRGRESSNIEDRRGMGGKGIAVGGGGIGVLLLSLVIYLCGGNEALNFFNQITGGDSPQVSQQPQQPNNPAQSDDQRRFAASVLGSTEDVWNQVLPQQARTRYREPKLVLFDDRVQSACGVAGSSTGPFYCPGDEKLYLDFSFFRDLKNEYKAPGDFAQAYVIAHEVGHHVQNIL